MGVDGLPLDEYVTKDTLAGEIGASDIDKAARIQGAWPQRTCGRRVGAICPEQSKRVSRRQSLVGGACSAAVGWVMQPGRMQQRPLGDNTKAPPL